MEGMGSGEHADERLLEGVAVLDFDMLCATVALQTQGFSLAKPAAAVDDGGGGEFTGVQRMWEGGVSGCFDDRRIALETLCCPCCRFGKNMGRAGFGSCFFQGTIYLLLALIALCNYISFIITKRHAFLYLGVVFTLSLLIYLGLFRTQIRKQFNIRVSDTSLDDCFYHLACSYCALCQEARTLEINNVQDGFWRGRGDTICVGSNGEGSKAFVELHPPPLLSTTQNPELCTMERSGLDANHSWNPVLNQSDPVVMPSISPASGS